MSLLLTRLHSGLLQLGEIALLATDVVKSLFQSRPRLSELVEHTYFIGVKSQSVVLITGGFTGMVLAAQAYFQFHTVGMDTAVLALVSVSMNSELGPVLTGLMVAGRVGAAIAAELGTMRVTEQIDALRTLATHPVDYLVTPRVIAGIVAMPLLAAEAVVVGIAAAYVISVSLMNIDAAYGVQNMLYYSSVAKTLHGLIKAAIFGALIGLIGSYKGLNCRDGAEGVGRATTEAVVTISISILISNFFLTLLLTKLMPP